MTEFGPRDYYYHSHVSVNDGSPAMVLAHNHTTIWLQNEDGYCWSDPIEQWERIENPEYPAEWADEDEGPDMNEPEYYDPSWDFPLYDPFTDHYERFGRPAFPNEY